jgi:hypothetical protein
MPRRRLTCSASRRLTPQQVLAAGGDRFPKAIQVVPDDLLGEEVV